MGTIRSRVQKTFTLFGNTPVNREQGPYIYCSIIGREVRLLGVPLKCLGHFETLRSVRESNNSRFKSSLCCSLGIAGYRRTDAISNPSVGSPAMGKPLHRLPNPRCILDHWSQMINPRKAGPKGFHPFSYRSQCVLNPGLGTSFASTPPIYGTKEAKFTAPWRTKESEFHSVVCPFPTGLCLVHAKDINS